MLLAPLHPAVINTNKASRSAPTTERINGDVVVRINAFELFFRQHVACRVVGQFLHVGFFVHVTHHFPIIRIWPSRLHRPQRARSAKSDGSTPMKAKNKQLTALKTSGHTIVLGSGGSVGAKPSFQSATDRWSARRPHSGPRHKGDRTFCALVYYPDMFSNQSIKHWQLLSGPIAAKRRSGGPVLWEKF